MTLVYHKDGLCYYWQGNNTREVPIDLFRDNLRRLCHRLRTNLHTPKKAWIILIGGKQIPFYNTDTVYGVFRQELFFMWTFGVQIADCIGLAEVATGNSYLFIPQLPEWVGQLMSPEDYKIDYKLTNVYYREELWEFLGKYAPDATLLTLDGVNSDSGLAVKQSEFLKHTKFQIRDNLLYNEMCELRSIKSWLEIDVLRYVAEITSEAHKAVMKAVRPNMMEYQCEAIFLQYIYQEGGCRFPAFTPICSSGPNTASLSYGHEIAPNNRKITKHDLCLFNMGASYCGYVSDVTSTFPATGIFTDHQKLIYNAVLECSRAVLNVIKPGQSWVTMHKLAHHVLLQNLKEISILRGSVEQMIKHDLGSYFQPHGLGHFVGLDVHDVGGYLPGYPKRSTERGLQSLRTARILQVGMVVTVEPGCYFIPKIINELRDSSDQLRELVDFCVLNNFVHIGGVRIGDVVFITNDGCEILSKVPRTVEEIESFMARGTIAQVETEPEALESSEGSKDKSDDDY